MSTFHDLRPCFLAFTFVTLAAGGLAFTDRTRGVPLSQSSNVNTAEPAYKYDTPGVKLEGRLIERTFFGPPGFGETPAHDAREKVLVLRLKKPITVAPVKNPEEEDVARHVEEVQLFFIPRTKGDEARKLLEKTVIAVGTLNAPTAPSEHLKVSMTVNTLYPK
jgi:hypothetical protein